MKLITVKEAIKRFNLTRHSIYQAIQSDKSFPVINIGPKKNYRIIMNELSKWISDRANSKKEIKIIPTGSDLLKGLRFE
jgi:predicted DNA-binding transcriptional regulator AlpA